MALSIKRLRWVLAAGALLLVVVLTVYIGYGRYLALGIYNKLLHRAGATISHDTNGITYSQTQKGRTVFTLHAKTATQLGEGKYDLHDVKVTLYNRDGKHMDYIYGDEFTYDENEGLVKAIGEVHMDLQAPQTFTAAGRSSSKPGSEEAPRAAKESDEVIHVRTSGLEYLKKLGVATTSEPVEFHYNGIECTAIGAEFDTDQNVLSLLSNVVADGLLRGQPMVVHATTVQVDRTANIARLTRTVADSQGRTASADLAILNLRKDGSIASAKATGHVLLTGKTQTVTSPQLDASFDEQTVPQTARLSGGVQLTDSSVLRPMKGSAATVDMVFDQQGAPASLVASGSPRMTLTDKRALDSGLLREMHGDRIVVLFAPAPSKKGSHSNSQISDLRAIGSAEARGESLVSAAKAVPTQKAVATQKTVPQFKTTILTADDLDMTFVPGAQGQSEPQKLLAVGHTLLRQDAPAGERETSAGDKLDAVFAQMESHGKAQLALASALQTGHVVAHRTSAEKLQAKGGMQQDFGTATGDRASYDGATEKLTLSGNAHLTQDNAALTAVTVVLDERTQDADAFGNVQATLEGNGTPTTATAPATSHPATFTHVLSASAHFTHESRQAEFHGTDAQPAKMWQEASQVQAATLLLDNVKRTLSARGATSGSLIHAVFAGTPADAGASKPAAQHQATQRSGSQNPVMQNSAGHSRYVRVASAKMDYSDVQREAVFSGPQGVAMQADAGTVHAERAVAYLQAAGPKTTAATNASAGVSSGVSAFNGSLDHVVITGDVELDQPGRHGTGEELVYTAATGDSVLTGSPGKLPRIVDAEQGNITGASLLFGDAGSTIIVSGESGASKPVRVHTETHIETRSDAKTESKSKVRQ